MFQTELIISFLSTEACPSFYVPWISVWHSHRPRNCHNLSLFFGQFYLPVNISQIQLLACKTLVTGYEDYWNSPLISSFLHPPHFGQSNLSKMHPPQPYHLLLKLTSSAYPLEQSLNRVQTVCIDLQMVSALTHSWLLSFTSYCYYYG